MGSTDPGASGDGGAGDRHRSEVVGSWLLVGVLLAAAAGSLAGEDYVWAAFATTTAVVAVVPAGVTRDHRAVVPPELLALPTLPVVARSVGAYVPSPPVLAPATVYAGVAALGLVIVVELDVFGTVEMSRRFAVAFVAMTTMAVAALWVVLRYVAGVTVGTEPFASNTALMTDLLVATGVGGLAGVVFDGYVQWRRPGNRVAPGSDDRLREATVGDDAVDEGPPEVAEQGEGEPPTDGDPRPEPGTTAGRGAGSAAGILVAAVRVFLAGLVVYAVVRVDGELFVNVVVVLGATLVPAAVRRRYGHEVGPRLAAWVAVGALLHAVGTLGLYRSVWWFDQFAHAVSGALVAGIGYAVAVTIDAATEEIRLPEGFQFAFLLVFVLATGVVWELVEFTAGGLPTLVGADAFLVQYGVADTAMDLSFDALGGVAVGLWGGGHVRDAATLFWTVVADRRPR